MKYQTHMIALTFGLAFNAYAGGSGDYNEARDRGLNLSRSTSLSESSSDAWAKADAEASARASIDGSGNSKAKATGGNQHQSQGQNVRAGGNKTSVNVSGADGGDGGDDSFHSRTTVWAPVIHGPAAAPLAGANIVMNPRPCGPRVEVMSAPVVGKRFGVLGGIRDVEQGTSETFVPASEPFLHRGNLVYGHEVVEYVAVLGTSSAGSFSVAGYGTDGNGVQGGASGGGALQQMVARVSVRECVMSAVSPAPVPASIGALPEPPVHTLPGPAPEPPEPSRLRPPGQERG